MKTTKNLRIAFGCALTTLLASAFLTGFFIPAAQASERELSVTDFPLKNVSKVNDLSPSLVERAVQTGEVGEDWHKENFLAGKKEPKKNYELMAAKAQIKYPVAIVGLLWKNNGTEALSILGRTKNAGQWSPWQVINDEIYAAQGQPLTATEPWAVIGASEVQAVAVTANGKFLQAPRIQIIDPGYLASDKTTGQTPKSNYLSARNKNRQQEDNVPALAYTDADGPEITPEPTPSSSQTPLTDEEKAEAEEARQRAEEEARQKAEADAKAAAEALERLKAWRDGPQPAGATIMHMRSQWGANESWMKWGEKPGALLGAVIHHTAGANNYTEDQVPAIIRGIYRYHAVTLGWGDIGYNVVVDNFGRAWQGRSGDVLTTQIAGGHAHGVNEETFGISVLGSYGEVAPSEAAQDTVARVIAYKFKAAGVDPRSTVLLHGSGADGTVPTIIGHRDVPGRGGKTACPGTAFWNELPKIRQMVTNYMLGQASPIDTTGYVAVKRPVAPKNLNRYSGSTRVETSVAIARAAFPEKPGVVYLARSDIYADALAAGALTDGPVLLTPNSGAIPEAVKRYIGEKRPGTVIALGGESVISTWRLQQLAQGINTVRIAGADRMETSLLIAQRAKLLNPSMDTVYLAEASKGIDALSAGALTNGPVILVNSKNTPSAQSIAGVANLGVSYVVALGGSAAISDQVLNQMAGNLSTARMSGADRYETSLLISRAAWADDAKYYYLANGRNSVDAVAGAILSGGPIVLVDPQKPLANGVKEDIKRLKPGTVVALGGEKSVPAKILNEAIASVNS